MHAQSSLLKLWLNLQCQMVTGTAQAVLVEHIAASHNKVAAKWPESDATNPGMIEAAREVVTKQRTHLAAEGEYLLLGQPVVVDGQFWGAVVLRIASRDQAGVGAALKLLKWGMTWLQFLLYQRESTPPAALINLLSGVLKEQTLGESAITAVNQLSTHLHCARVSLGFYRRNHIDLQAVSFSANFDKRTRAMQLIAEAMAEATDQHTDITYPLLQKEEQEEAEQLARHSHERLHQETGHALHTLVLRRGKHILGAITLESRSDELTQNEHQFIEQCLPALSDIFYIKQQATASIWQRCRIATVKRMHRWWGAEHWLGKMATATILAFLLLLMVPGNYHIQGEAVLQSKEKRVLVANQDGYLAQVNARPGDLVQQGDVLARLNDDELRLQRRKLASQLQQFRQEYNKALATGMRAEAAIASAQVKQAAVQLQLIEQQLERTRLKSPMDGIIVSEDISQSVGAPVQQGDVLFEIAATEGYRVVLYIDERDIAKVRTEQTGTLVLTSLPGQTFAFDVTRITPISEVRDGRNYFRVEANLTAGSDVLRPGMTGSGKIHAGERALGWIWFHGLFDWLRLALWW